MYQRILVPLDGSPTSDRGFEEAVALARVTKASLVLVHVMEAQPMAVEMVPSSSWQEICEGLRQQGRSLLERAGRTAAEHDVNSEQRLIENRLQRVADTIVDEARSAGCDLVVMGTHGRRGISHALLGSDAERVARQCPVPVLLVRHG
jgi:nucleotide-binding universal stress UspA family protein